MSLNLNLNLPGRALAKVDIASPQDRKTDEALGGQNQATETISDGLKAQRTALDRLVDQPGPLARFEY